MPPRACARIGRMCYKTCDVLWKILLSGDKIRLTHPTAGLSPRIFPAVMATAHGRRVFLAYAVQVTLGVPAVREHPGGRHEARPVSRICSGGEEVQAGSVDASPTSGSSPSTATYRRSAADGAGREGKERNKKDFSDEILDNCIWFLHGIWIFVRLIPVLSPLPACGAGGDEFTRAQLPRGCTGVRPSRGGSRPVWGATNPSWAYRGLRVWACSALAIAHPNSAAFCSSPNRWVLSRNRFGSGAFALILSLLKKLDFWGGARLSNDEGLGRLREKLHC